MKSVILLALAALLPMGAFAQPTIAAGGVLNNASYAPNGLPNADIAQGSIFVIFGSNMGPASITSQPSYPLTTTLAGTSVKVTVNGTTVDAIPIYTVAGQVGAILPSRTPIGAGTVTVTYNGQTSAAAPIKVVANSFGTFTLNQAGNGPGILTDVNYRVFGLNNAARPGDTIIIWGTGLGAITDSETATPTARDLTGIPVQVYIGGKLATLRYRGRSGCCAGLDQIVADIPQGVEGCYVSVVIVINNVVSNITTIPVASGNGRVCSDVNGLANTDLQALLNLGDFSIGSLNINRTTTNTPAIGPLPASKTQTDSGSAAFVKFNAAAFNSSLGLLQQASFGSCIVSTIQAGKLSTTLPRFTPLDAGPAITVTGGATGPKTLQQLPGSPGIYSATLGGGNAGPAYIPDAGGTFRFDNGAGGADVKSLNNATLAVPTPLVWTNMDQIPQNIPRNQNLLITWSGGDPNSYVTISGASILQNPTLVTSFSCTERVSAGQFSVPSYVLLALPPTAVVGGGGFSFPLGSLSVLNNGNPVKFTAQGIDFGFAIWSVSAGKSVNYQ